MGYTLIILLLLSAGVFYFFNKKKKPLDPALLAAVKYWQDKPLHNWTTTELEAKRQRQDPLADEIIKKIFENTDPLAVNTFYKSIHRTNESLPDDLPDFLKEYFKTGEQLPDWADPILLKRAEEFYIDHGDIIALVLCAKSLPECYACAKGAKVLYETGRLSEKNGSLNSFTRRVAETAQFIVNAMSPGGLSRNGLGIRSAQKVRLIHAAIRHYMHKEKWDAEQYGQPINQEDLAGTLMSFAPLVLEGLETLGVKISDVDKESYIHSWRVVGHFMGIDSDLLPNNTKDAFALGYGIFDKERAESEQGKFLTKSLIDFMTLKSSNHTMHLVVDDLLRLLISDQTADMLGVPPVSEKESKKLDKAFKTILGGWENFRERHEILRKATRPLSKLLLNGMLRMMNQGEKIHFFIPPSLRENWDLEE